MNTHSRLAGVLAPVITPFDDRLNPDANRLIAHCRWLLSQNVGLAVFGTNSEANSLSVEEKIELLDRIIDAGIDPARMMPGTGCCALSDSVKLTAHAVSLGCAGALMLPPFYYKAITDDGLFRSYAEIIERVADDRLRIYLYHIPPIAQVKIGVELIERLVTAYPGTVAGVKDSSGDWTNTERMLQSGWDNFQVFVGSESFLLQNMRAGGAGCISATANINPAPIHALFENWENAAADEAQLALNRVRDGVMEYPMIPALKATVAAHSNDDAWRRVRPPLIELSETQFNDLKTQLAELGFAMPGIGETS